ncbi:hypothetical protein BGZ82_006590 [Podila clonocystis]|nr:hypothetical protein BGZ82_006590 [Podila clonocystis]
MYKQLKIQGKLPKFDDGELPFSFVCLVCQSEAIDPKERPELDEVECCCQRFHAMQDAITFANWFNVLPSTVTVTEIEKAFEEYKQEQYP